MPSFDEASDQDGANARKSVVVVGAGLSGLYAAQILKNKLGLDDVIVVEASEGIGGRVKEVNGLVPWSLQLGPEFIHGKDNSVLMKLIDEWGWNTRELEWPDKYYFADTKTSCGSEDETRDVEIVHEFFDNILEHEEEEEDADQKKGKGKVNIKELLLRNGATKKQVEIAEVCYANDFGTSLNKLGLAEMKQEKLHWSYGEKYLVLDRPLSCVIDKLSEGVQILTNWQVKRVEYTSSVARGTDLFLANTTKDRRCRVVNQNGQSIKCCAVLLTVPLTILQDKDIHFSPPLPLEKELAISRIGMSTASKIFLIFKYQFWSERFWDACCPFGFLPEIWALRYPKVNAASTAPDGTQEEDSTKVAVVGFVAGDRAVEMSGMSEEDIVASSLRQLDDMFSSVMDPKPASKAYHSCYIKHWSDEPFIRGAYTYPGLADIGDRSLLSKPVGGLFFAGEATHKGLNPCMQGALETAERAVGEIWKTFDMRRGKMSKL